MNTVADTGLAGFRLVTLSGSIGSMHDAMRDMQDIIEPLFVARGLDVRPVGLDDWTMRAVPKLAHEIRLQRPDGILIQYPTGAFKHCLGPVALGLMRAAPTMVMLHEFTAAHPLRKAAVGGLVLRADRIGITAEREGQALVRSFPWLAGRLRMVPIASNIPGRPWAPATPPLIVYFGQLRPNKGLEQFAACVPKIRATLRQARFEVVGATVPQWQDYAVWLRNEANDKGFTVRTDVEIDEVARTLSQASVALLPFPGGASMRRGSMLAAAACGVPIVSLIGPDTPPEVLAFLERAETEDDLVALTIRYVTDKPARTAAHERSVRLDGQVGWDAIIDRYCEVFRELVQIKRLRSARVQ